MRLIILIGVLAAIIAVAAGGGLAAREILPLFLFFGGYFLPTLVAFARNHHNGSAIAILNLFLGWTGLGWIIALIWSATSVPRA